MTDPKPKLAALSRQLAALARKPALAQKLELALERRPVLTRMLEPALEQLERKPELARKLERAERKFGGPRAEIAGPERKRRQLFELIGVLDFLHQHNAPLKMHQSLLEITIDTVEALLPRSGRPPRSWEYRCKMATLAAAVTALTTLKKERGIEATIAEIATRHGIARKELSLFRDGLIRYRSRRKKADGLSRYIYERSVASFAKKSRVEIFAFLKGLYLTPSC